MLDCSDVVVNISYCLPSYLGIYFLFAKIGTMGAQYDREEDLPTQSGF